MGFVLSQTLLAVVVVPGQAGATRRGGAGGSNPDRARGRIKPGSGKRAGKIRNGGCAAPKKEKSARTANKTAVATVLAEIDLNPAPI